MKAKNILVGVIVAICAGTINIGYAVTPKYVTSSHTSITRAALEYYRNIEVSFSTITDSDISNMASGSYDEDASPLYTRAFNHFYDYYHRNNNGGGFYYQYDSAKQWAHDKARQSEGIYGGDFTWETAIYNYKAQNYSEAFFGLGHILHLIQDMCVPTHTRNDIHVGPINLLGEYEIYVDNWINDNKNNVASILSGDNSILDFNSIDEYFDYLSNYTQRNFYSGFSDAGTVFSMDYSENGNIFPSWTQKKDEPINGETFYFAYGKDPEGSGEIHLAYRVYKVPLTGWELWSAEHQAVHKDTWKRAGKLAMSATAGVVKLFLKEAASIQPGSVSVNPASGSWTTTPQNLAISSTNATAIYYTMVITTDGTTPVDPREPTSSDNDGSISVSGGVGTFQLYATTGQYKRSKLKFRGYNSAGAGAASGVYSYSINLSPTPGSISVSPSSGSWTSTPQNLAVSSSGATSIYYTMVNTTDGNTPADPREPTSSDNDGYISVSSGAGTFQLYGTTGQNKQSKLRFRGYNSAGAGPASGVYSYSINLSPTPGSISVNPASGSWTSTPQNLSVSSSNSTIIYYTMVNTYDGNTPADPREPTSSDNDGSIPVSGGAGTFQLYATAGQNKQTKLRFKGYNNAGAGPASGVCSYSINLGVGGWFYINTPSGMTWYNISQLWSGVSISNADRIYCTLRTTTDGSSPSDPPAPTPNSHDYCAPNATSGTECMSNNGEYITCNSGPFELYAVAGQYKRIKIRFGGYNDAGSYISDVFSYTIDNR